MKQIIEQKDLIGKTIQKTGYADNTFALFFDNEEYAIFRGCGWDSKDVELMEDEYSLDPTYMNCYELEELGVITVEEKCKIYEDRELEVKKIKEAKEKEEFNRLKLKYGS